MAGRVTAEAMSVVRMLDATRPLALRHLKPSRASMETLIETVRGQDGGEARRRSVETSATGWHAAFLRREIAGKAAVILTSRGDGPVPVLTTTWMLRFHDARTRDCFYDWLCDRLDRWPAWAEIAHRYAGPELTQHLQ